ncbi:unnamed protein product (macronuclear) [Paramecium tetraurelia]|uniref:Uncharacterized protein n=1 Tax=Paramecium tetraurelia TaxID=5888 RepID=A0CUH5_PARTE|nr:uncharacterized protein GSPATT00010642001 [Paramecium tetraurelia]CAK74442.1 unnamed protein product [Paramecium tetraurelia]|eukprot:XP_001441839.1 hypothetical protein (macronuclear) [Paramecium tetraurelia strain d4-2]
MIQVILFDSQLKYQDDDYVKQNIFKSNMKHTYTPKNIDNNYYVNNLRHSNQESVNLIHHPTSKQLSIVVTQAIIYLLMVLKIPLQVKTLSKKISIDHSSFMKILKRDRIALLKMQQTILMLLKLEI